MSSSSEIKSESSEAKRATYLFGGLKVEIQKNIGCIRRFLISPFIPKKAFKYRHWSGNLAITGDIQAQKGTLYLFNNALKIDKLKVDFPKVRTTVAGQAAGLNPDILIETSFNVKGADQAVKAIMKGKLENLVEIK